MNINIVALRNMDAWNSSKFGRLRKLTLLFAVVLLAAQMTGCSLPSADLFQGELIDTAFSKYRDKVWSKRACNLRYSNCNRPYQEHFQAGFEAGYTDICTGGDGYVPATPPEKYWGFEYQTPDGSQCVKSWFEGYPAGVAAAKRDRAGTYRSIYVSKMIESAISQDKTPKTTPSQVPVVRTADNDFNAYPPRRGQGLEPTIPSISPTNHYDPSLQMPHMADMSTDSSR